LTANSDHRSVALSTNAVVARTSQTCIPIFGAESCSRGDKTFFRIRERNAVMLEAAGRLVQRADFSPTLTLTWRAGDGTRFPFGLGV
jgi:hypothetical protein